MVIASIVLENFRNYAAETFDFSPGRNVIFGDNAQGKTNLLEAVAFLSSARSFRGAKDAELVRTGAPFAAVEARVQTGGRELPLRAEFAPGQRKKLYAGGVKMRTAGEFSGRLRTVLFSPDDLSLVRAGASERRRFMNLAFSQLRPRYADSLARYTRLHEQKTRLLRDYREDPAFFDLLDAYNIQIAETGAALIRFRALFCREISRSAAAIHSDISGGRERLTVRYKTVSTVRDPSGPEEEIAAAILEHMRTHRAAELASGQALSGPHKDDLELFLGELPAKSYASQGQSRTAALALKLAERELLLSESGEEPVLLLDDVLSELDSGRRNYILNHLGDGQVILTHCDPADTAGFGGRLFEVRGGKRVE